MHSFVLLIWISLVVIVGIRADVIEDDFLNQSDICAQCNEASLPKCQSTDHLQYNEVINCPHAEGEACVIGVVKINQDSENHTENVMCVMDGIEVLEETLTPLTLLVSTTESTPIEGSVQANVETSNESLPSARVEMVTESSQEATVEDNNLQAADEVAMEAESQSQIAGYVEITTEQSKPQLPTAEVESQSVPTAVVQTPIEDDQSQLTEAVMQTENQSPTAVDVEENLTPFKPIEENTIGPVSASVMQTTEMEDYQADAPGPVFESDTEKAQLEMTVNLQQASEPSTAPEKIEPMEAAQPSNAGQESAMSAVTESIVQVEQVTVQVPSDFQSCYECTSTNDQQCMEKPNRQINCKALEGKKNGCYTLLKVDTNVTTRGCISDLTEEGTKYCKKNTKVCILCYDSGCNNRQMSSSAAGYNSWFNALLLLASVGFIKFI